MVRITRAGRRAMEAAAPAHVENVQCYFIDLLSNDELEVSATVFDRALEKVTTVAT
jgi:hypothetical protein